MVLSHKDLTRESNSVSYGRKRASPSDSSEGRKPGQGGETGQPGRNGAMRSWSRMMIVVVIMRRRRTALKDMKAIMVTRMTAILEALIIKIHAVEADNTDDAHGRNERYCDFVGFFRVTYYKEAFRSMFQESLRSG